jgi:pimeloyl-ACP methyl ester carboxylesterase
MKDIYWTKAGRERVLERYAKLLKSWPVPFEARTFGTSQGTTVVLDSGNPSSPPLVLFHGGYCNSLMWARSVSAWSDNFRVLSVDIIGDPGYSAPSRPGFTDDRHALWIDDIWNELGLRQASLVGASLGGWLALDYASRRPERVNRLVALAPAGIVKMSLSASLKILPFLFLGEWGFRKAFARSFGIGYESLKPDERVFFDFLALMQRNVIGRARLPGVLSDAALASISMPLKIILGERDVFFNTAAAARRVLSLAPHAELLRIPGVGHGLVDPTPMILEFMKPEFSPRVPPNCPVEVPLTSARVD